VIEPVSEYVPADRLEDWCNEKENRMGPPPFGPITLQALQVITAYRAIIADYREVSERWRKTRVSSSTTYGMFNAYIAGAKDTSESYIKLLADAHRPSPQAGVPSE